MPNPASCVFSFAVLGTLGLLTSASIPADAQSALSFVEWAKTAAIPLNNMTDQALSTYHQRLDKMLRGRRIVYLSETDHYVSEKYDFRLMWIRYLQKKGFRHIGMEMGRSDGAKINSYLKSGDIKRLDDVCIYGSQRCSRPDRNDTPSGTLQTLNPAGRDRFVKEERWFHQQLRELSISNPLDYFGFDVDTRPGGGYGDIENLLSSFSHRRRIRTFLNAFRRVEGETLTEEIQRLTKCVSQVEQNVSAFERVLGHRRFTDFRHSLLTLRDSLQFAQIAFANPSREALLQAYTQREKNVMFRQLDEQLAKLPKGEGLILMGHSMHLSKQSASLRFGRLDDNSAPRMWPSIGSYLNDLLPHQVFSIWMLYNQGGHWDLACAAASCAVRANENQIESKLSLIGDAFILPTQSDEEGAAVLNTPVNFQQNGGYGSGILSEQADALVFFNSVTAPKDR